MYDASFGYVDLCVNVHVCTCMCEWAISIEASFRYVNVACMYAYVNVLHVRDIVFRRLSMSMYACMYMRANAYICVNQC
jgi:hypothetical protein